MDGERRLRGDLPINDMTLTFWRQRCPRGRQPNGTRWHKVYRKTPYTSRYLSQDALDGGGGDTYSNEDAHKLGLHDLFVRLLTDPQTASRTIKSGRMRSSMASTTSVRTLKCPNGFAWLNIYLVDAALSSGLGLSSALPTTPFTADKWRIHLEMMHILEHVPCRDICDGGIFILSRYENLVPKMAKVLRNSVEQDIPAQDIVL
ncbi:Sodium/potassium-transporting ATPase subunit alpha, partial [Caligus rogercresseyi]